MFWNNARARFRQWIERHIIADDPMPERSRLDIMCEGSATGTAAEPPEDDVAGGRAGTVSNGQPGD
ncbi:hypothetical protein [Arthrobacter sp. HY1533]|uniref:hypothetical protein n=1 Tax=Arthrobacter sp. HY1533 TaxID=2970919 RepID=UPI0022BA03C6|nr:hypothetical protein [Arthrobacter sp. HY1533]